MTNEEYGQRLRDLRGELGLSLREVEERGGPSKDVLSPIERGLHKPRTQTLGRIAQAFGMSVSELRNTLEPDSPKAPEPLSLEWARAASDAEFYRLIVMAPEGNTAQLDKLTGELHRFISRPVRRILTERNNKGFEDQGPEPNRDEYDRMKERFDALYAEVNRRRPPFAWVRISDEGNECHWYIPPDQWEEHRESVDRFFDGEPYADVDAREEAQKKTRGYKEAFLRAA